VGAFFLYASDASVNETAVREVFRKKGFSEPAEFSLGRMSLWLYRKQLLQESNYLFSDAETAVFAVGTFAYKRLSYPESLAALLGDFTNDALDIDGLLGAYCLVFWGRGRIRVLTDPLNVYHVFVDEQASRLSSSFLAVLASHAERLSVNRLALYERLLTGYVTGPETLVSGIHQLTRPLQERMGGRSLCFVKPSAGDGKVDEKADGQPREFGACVDEQIGALVRYCEGARRLAEQYHAELGLSSGYDSRLLFALLSALCIPRSVHSHWTLGVHEPELAVVRQMAELSGTTLRIVKTTLMDEKPDEEIASILLDTLYYFDVRGSAAIGSVSETHTRRYRVKTLGESRLTFHGAGGEIYRDFQVNLRRRFSFAQWMLNHVYYAAGAGSLTDAKLEGLVRESMIRKAEDLLGVALGHKVDQLAVRRYYGEVRGPYCDGNVNNAQNQLTFCLTPFLEPSVVRSAYRAIRHAARSGRFQAAMIARLDSRLASLPSHYGFPLVAEPLHQRLRGLVKGYTPDWLLRAERGLRRQFRHNGSIGRRPAALTTRSATLRECLEALREFAPAVNVQRCMRDPTQANATLFVGCFLREFHGCLKS
jgi:hypothetical protein